MFSTLRLFAGVVLGLMLMVGAHAQTAVEKSLSKHVNWSLLHKDILEINCRSYATRSVMCSVGLGDPQKKGLQSAVHFQIVGDYAQRYLNHGLYVAANTVERRITTAYSGASMPREDAVDAVNAIFKDATLRVFQVYTESARVNKNLASYD